MYIHNYHFLVASLEPPPQPPAFRHDVQHLHVVEAFALCEGAAEQGLGDVCNAGPVRVHVFTWDFCWDVMGRFAERIWSLYDFWGLKVG